MKTKEQRKAEKWEEYEKIVSPAWEEYDRIEDFALEECRKKCKEIDNEN